ncbi:MAG: UDP-N-acetylmuramoyl-tripeptide--D-alanyl-D-alanine ligase [Planctomycetales bacterium]|nr:UDP-N-acetylmuramoyl-tripeptide--D-alanyl-D-alanine ligase [Planctomycetales bacterium]
MTPMTFSDLAAAAGGRILARKAEGAVSGVAIHSAEARPGDLFVALRGKNRDGHDFLADAASRGAAAALVSRAVPRAPLPLVKVRDTVKGLGHLAARYRQTLRATVVAVTGTVGKTTTKELLFHALGGPGLVVRSPRSYNNHLGVPLSLLSAGPEHRAVVLEIGGSAPGEIGRLSQIARPRFAVLTAVGEAHLRGFGDLAGVARGKSEVLLGLPRDGVAILNGDDPVVRAIARIHPGESRLFGCGPHVGLRGEAVERTPAGLALLVRGERFEVPGLSPPHATNVLGAIGVGLEMGIPLPVLARRLRGFAPAPGRLAVTRIGPLTLLDDAYNANPVSARAAFREVTERAAARRVVVFGEMRDLGSHSARLHRETGEALALAAAAAPVDLLVAVGAETAPFAEAARARETLRLTDADEAVRTVPGLLKAGDLVLVKASHDVGLDRVVTAVRERWEVPLRIPSETMAGATA